MCERVKNESFAINESDKLDYIHLQYLFPHVLQLGVL